MPKVVFYLQDAFGTYENSEGTTNSQAIVISYN
jgi:hypothetical protein